MSVDHRFSDAFSVSSRASYIDARATFRELYPDVYSNPLNPFLDGTAETGRTVNRFAYQTKPHAQIFTRSEEHTSELQSLMRISYAVFCLNKNTHRQTHTIVSVKLNASQDEE